MISPIKFIPVFVFSVFAATCTDHFFAENIICPPGGGKAIAIEVVDQNDDPVTGAGVTIVNKRTGKAFCVDEQGDLNEFCLQTLGETGSHEEEGSYVIISGYNTATEAATADVRHLDVIEATIEKDGAMISPQYIVKLNDSKCYPESIKGPRTVMMELPQ